MKDQDEEPVLTKDRGSRWKALVFSFLRLSSLAACFWSALCNHQASFMMESRLNLLRAWFCRTTGKQKCLVDDSNKGTS